MKKYFQEKMGKVILIDKDHINFRHLPDPKYKNFEPIDENIYCRMAAHILLLFESEKKSIFPYEFSEDFVFLENYKYYAEVDYFNVSISFKSKNVSEECRYLNHRKKRELLQRVKRVLFSVKYK